MNLGDLGSADLVFCFAKENNNCSAIQRPFPFFLLAAAAASEEVNTKSVCRSHNRFFEVEK
jgi:hypothetical protein